MKSVIALLFLSFAAFAAAQTTATPTSTLSPAEQSMANARKEIAKKPRQFSMIMHKFFKC